MLWDRMSDAEPKKQDTTDMAFFHLFLYLKSFQAGFQTSNVNVASIKIIDLSEPNNSETAARQRADPVTFAEGRVVPILIYFWCTVGRAAS